MLESPSLGREWIEIFSIASPFLKNLTSPSLGREWIEIFRSDPLIVHLMVSLLGEGVD